MTSYHLPKLIAPALLLLLFAACEPNAPASTEAASTRDSSQQTQALLLLQEGDFDPANPADSTRGYTARQRVVVPKNLSPQNKWVMFEGPVLENDLVAYRFYMDARHRFDVYGKRVSDLVMDTVSWKYHDIMDWGSDILKVNTSLGIGSPAIWYQDSLYALSEADEKVVEVVESGGQRSAIRTTFRGLNIGGQRLDLVQEWSIGAGEPFSVIELRVENGRLPAGMTFATGWNKLLPDYKEGNTDGCFYAFNWGTQSYHNENMGMGVAIDSSYAPRRVENAESHVYTLQGDQRVQYRLVAAWERDVIGVKDQAGFEQLMQSVCGVQSR